MPVVRLLLQLESSAYVLCRMVLIWPAGANKDLVFLTAILRKSNDRLRGGLAYERDDPLDIGLRDMSPRSDVNMRKVPSGAIRRTCRDRDCRSDRE